jgi:integrase
MIVPTLLGFLDTVYLPSRLQLTAGSAQQLRIAVGRFGDYLHREPLLSDLRKDTVLDWMRWLAESSASSTINSKRRAILTLWREAADHELVPPPGRIPRLREPQRIPIAWTLGELERIFRAADQLTGWWSGVPVSLCWRLGLLLFWDTGSRLGPILKARTAQVDVEARTLLVPAEHIKGQRADRLFLLHSQTVNTISESQPSERKMLFPFPWGRRQIWFHLKAILRAAGLPDGRQRMFHCFRRSAESHAASAKGIEFAAAAIGHGVEVARKSYISPLICRPPALIEALPRPKF